LLYKIKVTDKYNKGWHGAYTGFLDNDKALIIPFVIGYGQSRAKSNLVQEHGFSSVDSYALGFRCNGYIKITLGVYIALGLNVPIGMEVLRDLEYKKSTNFLRGLRANQADLIVDTLTEINYDFKLKKVKTDHKFLNKKAELRRLLIDWFKERL
jgi:hypothetical protein